MAAVAQTAVTIERAFDEGNKAGQFIQAVRVASVVLAAQGGTADDIPASLFSLAEIYEARGGTLNASGTLTHVDVVVEADALGVLTCDETGAVANTTGTLRMIVKGRPL